MIENRYDDFKTEVKRTNRKWKINVPSNAFRNKI